MFACVVIAALVLACGYHATLASLGFKYPWTTFLFIPEDRFNDWHNSVAAAATFNPYYAATKAVSAYFPVAYQVFLVGGDLSPAASTAVYLAISVCLLAASIIVAWRYLQPEAARAVQLRLRDLWLLLLACLLSYPVLFALDRGNIDLWIASLCLIYVATLRTQHEPLGFAALALAISLKAYPLAFLALAVTERKYRAAFLCAAAAGLATVLTLAGMRGGFSYNLNGLMLNLHRYYEVYVLGTHSMFASSDPYNGIRTLILGGTYVWQKIVTPGMPTPEVKIALKWVLENWGGMILQVYSVLSLSFALVCAFFVLAVPAPRWRRIMAVCLVAILFPNVANDYKLNLLLPGMLALLLDPDAADRRGRTAFVLLCVLMIPKSYYFIHGLGVTNIITPVLLIAMSYYVLMDRPAWRRGLRLLRFRIVWHSAQFGPDALLRRAITLGKPAPFLARNHWSMPLG